MQAILSYQKNQIQVKELSNKKNFLNKVPKVSNLSGYFLSPSISVSQRVSTGGDSASVENYLPPLLTPTPPTPAPGAPPLLPPSPAS